MANDRDETNRAIRRKKMRKRVRNEWDQSSLGLSLPGFAGAIKKFKNSLPGSAARIVDARGASIELDKRYEQVLQAFGRRSKQSRATDKGKLAKLTLNPRKWERNPSRYDFPGVDTPEDADLSDRLPSTLFDDD